MNRLPLPAVVLIALAVAGRTPAADPAFNADVRPIFQAYCSECHGEAAKPKAGLDLRLRRTTVAGGKTGPAVVPGKPGESLLLERVIAGDMPPGKKKLTKEQIDVLKRWVAAGAKVETTEPGTLAAGFPITAEDRRWWAFQPVMRPAVPDRAKHPVDAFLRAKLSDRGLSFAPPADRTALLRRVTFDLTGLPPTPDEVDAFLKDASHTAYETVVDRLLASPAYGERWARHWLDVAGYADSEGGSPDDPVRTTAWKYRDYVIRSFNADQPFDRFIVEQLAGDELLKPPYTNLTPEQLDTLTATGFLRLVPDGTGGRDVDQKLARNQVLTDTVKVVSSTFLGLTVGCAQCHNHRYDPIPQTDFYRLRAFFEPAYDPGNWKLPAARQVSLYTDADRKKAAAVEAEAAKIDKDRLKKQDEFINATFEKELAKLPDDTRERARTARGTAVAKRTAEQKKLMQQYPSLNVSAGSLYLYDGKAAAELKTMADAAAALRKTKPPEEFVRVLTETPGKVPTTHLHHRGDPDQTKEAVAPGGLAVLDDTFPLTVPAKGPNGTTGRRLAFAKWLTDPKNPLTARVLVNRIWMHHFGRGLVGTPGDLGRLGEKPTHPELLDYLASEFVVNGWSVKKLHRLIVTSAAYRQASARDPKADAADPDNKLLHHYPLRRLDAEAIRDAMLAVSGKLTTKLYGPPVPVKENEVGAFVLGIENKDGAGRFTAPVPLPPGDEHRRSLYVQVRRTRPLAVLDAFDWANPEPNCEARNSSTATPQSLMLLNGEFVIEMSEAFADRVKKEAGDDPAAQVKRAWRLAYGTEPTAEQVAAGVAYLREQTSAFRKVPMPQTPKGGKPAAPQAAGQRALATFCQALLGSNCFLYLD
jgi:mono/diheme cytochrome c family protein